MRFFCYIGQFFFLTTTVSPQYLAFTMGRTARRVALAKIHHERQKPEEQIVVQLATNLPTSRVGLGCGTSGFSSLMACSVETQRR